MKEKLLVLTILLFQIICFGQLESNQKNFKSAVLIMSFGHDFDDPITREFLEEAEQDGIIQYNLQGAFEEKKYAWKKFILDNESLCPSNIKSEWQKLASSTAPYGLRIHWIEDNDPNKEFLQKQQEDLKKSQVKISYINNDRLRQFIENYSKNLCTQAMANSIIDILFYCERMSTEKEGLIFLELLSQKGIIKFNRTGQIDEMIVALKETLRLSYPLKIDIKEDGKNTVLSSSTSKFGLRSKIELMISQYNPITENDLWFIDQKKRMRVTEINDNELQKFIKEYSKNKK